MAYSLEDTIAAVASAPGGAARGIVRLAGPKVIECLERCFAPRDSVCLRKQTRATVINGTLRVEAMELPVPCDLYLWPTSQSYTRSPLAEIHVFGSPPILGAVLQTVCARGARVAEPGEFTLRAFLAGRLDLTQAEAVLGVVDSNDRRQFDVALCQLAGGLSGPLKQLRQSLVDLLAQVEAGLDFADEDIEFISTGQLKQRLARAADDVARVAEQMDSRAESVETPRVVIVGGPNVGKSSLFNALTTSAAAIVSHVPGTTRDYLTAELELDGVKCQLIDTAGINDGLDDKPISEKAGEITSRQRETSHVEIMCLDATRPPTAAERTELTSCDNPRRLVMMTKCDAARNTGPGFPFTQTSSHTGLGLDMLRAELRRLILTEPTGDCAVVAATAARCRECLRGAKESLDRARGLAASSGGEELIAVEIRTALVELGKVVGEVYTDDILDRIFSRFCIGK